LSLCDAVGITSGADEQRFMEESPPCAEGEKGLPLRAKLDVKSGGHVGGARQPLGLARCLFSGWQNLVAPQRKLREKRYNRHKISKWVS
jgi:hypothetical protein